MHVGRPWRSHSAGRLHQRLPCDSGFGFTRKPTFSITTLDDKEASLQENAEAIEIQENIWNEHPDVHGSPAVLVLFDETALGSLIVTFMITNTFHVRGTTTTVLPGLVMHECVHTHMWRSSTHMITFGIPRFFFLSSLEFTK